MVAVVAGTAGITAVSPAAGSVVTAGVSLTRRPCTGMMGRCGTATRPPAGFAFPPGTAGRGGGSL
ncbi:hypothetical protein Misp05_53760 [Micromonospora sp. NBRC 107095]|nr:hypothetical protein Misp05_53760 [Micromonospora sp. NBRC 107095]